MYAIMLKSHTVLILGLWLIIVSFSGVPTLWKIRLYIATGIFLVVLYVYHLGREAIMRLAAQQSQNADTFTENGGRHDASSGAKSSS